jgi:hypothetical protein
MSMCIAFHALVILYTVHTLSILYVYDLFHILLSVSQTYGSAVCMYVRMYVCVYERAVHIDSN